jgi:hypothetical protein
MTEPKYWEQTKMEQMGNIGSEVCRAIIAHRNGNKARIKTARIMLYFTIAAFLDR